MHDTTPTPTDPADPTAPPRRRRGAVLGVTAGLLAGGAIGLVATVPSLTSAAPEDPALGEADTDVAVDAAPTGEGLRELLQPLVDDGTIDAAQADAVTEHLVENRPERDGHRGRRGINGHGRHSSVVADLLGLEREELRAELEAGTSIADIAGAQGIDIDTVVDALIADAESHIDLAVAHGLDEETAAERLERISERIAEGVNRSRTPDEG